MLQNLSWPAKPNYRYITSATLVMAVVVGLLGIFAADARANLLGGADPLSPEVAFVPETGKVTDSTIGVEFDIESGYYLYRDKTSFTVESITAAAELTANSGVNLPVNALQLDRPTFPEAMILDDEFFGEMAIYRDKASIEIPYSSETPLAGARLAVKYQGCADIGLCYPPTTQYITVAFDSVASDESAGPPDPLARTSSAAAPGRSLTSLSSHNESTISTDSQNSALLSSSASTAKARSDVLGLDSNQQELLSPELAYLPNILSADQQQISIRWHIEDGYYLYRDKLSFSLQQTGDAIVHDVAISQGIEQFDEFFGNVAVLRNSAEARLTLTGSIDAADRENASLQINYQGCADIGVCFPPSVVTLPLVFSSGASDVVAGSVVSMANPDMPSVSGSSALSATTDTTQLNNSASAQVVLQSEQDRLFTLLGTNSLWLNVVTFFGLGLLLAFTPCVLPMIPILSSLIVGKGESMNTGKAFRLSLVYVLVMASTYALVGVAVGLSGYNVQAFLQNPWVLSAIAALFVVLSLSMFGFYELQMPTVVQAKLTQLSNKQNGGDICGVAAMGFISTLIVGPCVTAPLAGALIYIANTGDAVIGGAALFSLGMGMGAPLLLIGTSAGRLLPRAGAWMNATKHLFGILMLAMAIYMISRFLPTTIIMALYGVLALMSGIYLGAADTITRDSQGWQRFGKGAGVVVSAYGLALLVGALSGSNSYTTPLRGIAGTSTGQSSSDAGHSLTFAPVKSLEGLQQVVANASREGRPVMLDFYADWCISCKEMEAFTFTDETVQSLLANAVLVQADVTANDTIDQALLKHFDLFGPPGIIFYDADGNELRPARVVGFMSAANFANHLRQFLGDSSTVASVIR